MNVFIGRFRIGKKKIRIGKKKNLEGRRYVCDLISQKETMEKKNRELPTDVVNLLRGYQKLCEFEPLSRGDIKKNTEYRRKLNDMVWDLILSSDPEVRNLQEEHVTQA